VNYDSASKLRLTKHPVHYTDWPQL